MQARQTKTQSSKPAKGRISRASAPSLEQSLALILEGTTEGYWDWQLKSGDIDYGQGWLSSLGYLNADLPRDPSFWESIIHPDDLPKFESGIQEHLQARSDVLDCEVRLRAKSGHYKWFRARGRVMQRDRRGTALRMVGTIADIQPRKRAQAELAESRAQLEALFESTNDIIWSVDARDLKLLAFNKAFGELFVNSGGIHVRTGMHSEDLFPAERAMFWKQLCKRVLEEGQVHCDCELVLPQTIWHLTAHKLTRDSHVFGISVFGHDITERKRMEEALRKSEEKFSKAFMESPMPVAITTTRDDRYVEVNEAFEQATGYSREEVLNRTPFDLNIWVAPEQRVALAEVLKEKGHFRNVEVEYRTKAGQVRDGLGSAALVEINDEPCMLSVIIDVTDRNQAERNLQDSEERLRLAVASRRMYAFEWRPAEHVVIRSSESSKILGSGIGEIELFDQVHPEDREAYKQATGSLTAEQPKYKVIFRFPRNDGNVSWLEESGHAFFDTSGRIERVVGMVSDITDIRESERVLRELSGRLITSQEEERRRVARELHDNIGQELALLSVQAQRIDSGVSEAEKTIHSDVHELYKRIKEIATKVSNLSHRLHSSELEFLGLTIAVERLCRDFGRQYGIEVDYQIKDVPKGINGSVALCFYRIVQEALQNVAKHSRGNRVELELAYSNSNLRLLVRDNGVGFATERFAGRSGLGLVSIRERMNLIGGHLEINSSEGRGTEIKAVVALPGQIAPEREREHEMRAHH